MEHSRRHFRTNGQGNPTRTEEDVTQTTGHINKQQYNQPGQKQHKNCRYKKPNIAIANLSNYQLSKVQVTLLTKGLNFIPTPRKDYPAKYFRIYYYLIGKSGSSITFTTTQITQTTQTPYLLQDNNPIEQPTNTIPHPSSGWTSLVDRILFWIHTKTP